eukprot:TRINITY_DN5890_c0_g1_i1.p1 TRINITY_DN5890_c0_g1~~TRINITY_DN5890_c0_g1_i1.p1  ORF type:complete len:200 (+),score=44.95 TRINITY_DN5890_c0_g1_i1:107-706(+)
MSSSVSSMSSASSSSSSSYNTSVVQITGILILDSDGKRLAVKYYDKDMADKKQQESFEKKLFEKTGKSAKSDVDIALLDKYTVLYKSKNDLILYVLSTTNENELIINAVLNNLDDALLEIVRQRDQTNTVCRKTLLENIEYVFLTFDEMVDDGMILETDAYEVANRVTMEGAIKDIPITELTLAQVLTTAKEQLVKSFS